MIIKVLYEDKDILAIDKPSGISVHPSASLKINHPTKFKPVSSSQSEEKKVRSGGEKFITDWVEKNYPSMKNVGEPLGDIKRPGIVHRLDRDTSGVLLLAKTEKAHEFLKKQFVDRKVKKTYHAIVSGFVKNDRGVVNKPIGKSPRDFRRRLAGRGAKGKLREAVTEYKVLERFADKTGNKFTYLEVKPQTGRTHQIRVHMKFLNHPVACDSLYNPDKPCPSGISRLALHAKSIQFENLRGSIVQVESPLPREFKKTYSSPNIKEISTGR